jgi:hypothetical protein
MDPFELETLAHQLVEIGVRLMAVALKIAEQVGTPTVCELDQTAQRTVREAMRILNDPNFQFVPENTLPWP